MLYKHQLFNVNKQQLVTVKNLNRGVTVRHVNKVIF